MQAIHSTGVFGWVEQPDVSFVHPQAGKPAVSGAGSENLAGVGIPLDGKDGDMSKDKVGVDSAAAASKEMTGSHFTANPSGIGMALRHRECHCYMTVRNGQPMAPGCF